MRYVPPKNKATLRREQEREVSVKPARRRHLNRQLVARMIVYSVLVIGVGTYGIHANRWYNTTLHAIEATERKVSKPPVMLTVGKTTISALPSDYKKPTNIWTVVNKNRIITPIDYTPSKLTPLNVPLRKTLPENGARLLPVVAANLEKLVHAAQADDVNLAVNSAYRPLEDQRKLLEAATGDSEQEKYTAPLGGSEHQLGLAVDLSTALDPCVNGEFCYLTEEDAAWLANHAHEYGFILRYPDGKQAITGYEYESWHYRYVGKPLATALYKNALTLEEVIPSLEAARQQLLERNELH